MEKCKALGRDAVALTDHGSLGGLAEFHKAAHKAGVKPILGCEFYHDKGGENCHLVLLARNRKGYDNLVRLNNLAQDHFYKKPRITDEMLRDHGGGLIALTACIQGYMAKSVLAGAPDWEWFEHLQGWVDFAFLEVQNHGITEEQIVRSAYLRAGKRAVGTTDAHYLEASNERAHGVGLAVAMNKKEGEFTFNGTGYHVRPDSEIDLAPDALEMTYEVAKLVDDYDIGHESWQLPAVKVDQELEKMELEARLYDYLIKRYGFENVDVDVDGTMEEYGKRLAYEFEVISKNGFLPYFKIVADICQYVDGLGHLRGWGRGSAAGSLVAFLYRITKIDPIEWGLYFERFLNPDRITPPDIDLDFQPEDREPVIEYMRQKYGRVYQIGTYTTLGPKEVILSCSRAMGVQTELSNFVPVEAPVPPISELIGREAFARQVKLEGNEEFVSICMALEGLPRNRSAHASGVVIDEAGELPYQVSRTGTNAGLPVTSYDMYSLEDLKYTKIDVLGVNMLAMIDRACKAARVKVDDFPLNDARTFELFNSGFTLGAFQFETHSFSRIIKDLHPDSFDELVDLNTLGRPGCLESGMTEEYVERKWGRRPVAPIHPKLKGSSKHLGLPLFQEQMMEISRELAGFTMSEADTLRKAIGKKQKELFEQLHQKFVDGCLSHSGVPAPEAEEVWAALEKSARYTWNLSHAVCYTLISYWTMYLAAHHPAEFFCELINGAGDAARRRVLLSECKRRGIPVQHPLINDAGREPRALNGGIVLGLSGIKFVGDKSLEAILKARESGPFTSVEDVKARSKVNSRVMEFLTKAGCFPNTHVPTRDDEIEALGYSVSGRVIDTGFLRYVDSACEVVDVKAITTKKKGEPMCFLSAEFHDGVRSVTVFPRQYKNYKDLFVPGAVLGVILNEDILEAVYDPDDVSGYFVEIPEGKADEFLCFYPSLVGEPNVYAGSYGLARVNLTREVLDFIDREFGVVSMGRLNR